MTSNHRDKITTIRQSIRYGDDIGGYQPTLLELADMLDALTQPERRDWERHTKQEALSVECARATLLALVCPDPRVAADVIRWTAARMEEVPGR